MDLVGYTDWEIAEATRTGRKDEPLYRSAISSSTATSVSMKGAESNAAWPAHRRSPRRGPVRVAGQGISERVYLTDDPKAAALLLDKVIAGCSGDVVEEICSLGNTPSSWRTEALAHHTTGASTGPTEGQPLRETREAMRARLQALRPLQAPSASPRRRCYLAEPSSATSGQNALSPVRRVGPQIGRDTTTTAAPPANRSLPVEELVIDER